MDKPIDLKQITLAYGAGLVNAQDVARQLIKKLPSGAPEHLVSKLESVGKWDSDELSECIYEIELVGYRVITDWNSGL